MAPLWSWCIVRTSIFLEEATRYSPLFLETAKHPDVWWEGFQTRPLSSDAALGNLLYHSVRPRGHFSGRGASLERTCVQGLGAGEGSRPGEDGARPGGLRGDVCGQDVSDSGRRGVGRHRVGRGVRRFFRQKFLRNGLSFQEWEWQLW